MAFNVNEFRSTLKLDGARPNLFEVRVPNIDGVIDTDFVFMCKTAQLPGSTVGVVEVPYFGRAVKLAGNRTFAEWTVTVINDENFKQRNTFERWHSALSSNAGNLRAQNKINSTQYSKQATVIQYGKSGDKIKEYTFHGMFPTDITPIDLDWGNNDTIEEFSVTFAYQYWTTDDRVVSRNNPGANFNTQDGSTSG